MALPAFCMSTFITSSAVANSNMAQTLEAGCVRWCLLADIKPKSSSVRGCRPKRLALPSLAARKSHCTARKLQCTSALLPLFVPPPGPSSFQPPPENSSQKNIHACMDSIDHALNTPVGVRWEMDPSPVHGCLLTWECEAPHSDTPSLHLLIN
jgi:hypothetical protein